MDLNRGYGRPSIPEQEEHADAGPKRIHPRSPLLGRHDPRRPSAAAEFYSGLFGWETENALPSDSPGEYHLARIRGRNVAAIGSRPQSAPPNAMWNTYIWVDSADEAATRAQEAGGQVLASRST